MVLGEISNFAAYAFAPAILVTPLGALSVLVGYATCPSVRRIRGCVHHVLTERDVRVCSAVLGTYFLKEELGTLGKLGCAICLIGSVIIVLHAPPDEEIDRIDEILHHAIQPGSSPPLPRRSTA